jgi:hypothetical protein
MTNVLHFEAYNQKLTMKRQTTYFYQTCASLLVIIGSSAQLSLLAYV